MKAPVTFIDEVYNANEETIAKAKNIFRFERVSKDYILVVFNKFV